MSTLRSAISLFLVLGITYLAISSAVRISFQREELLAAKVNTLQLEARRLQARITRFSDVKSASGLPEEMLWQAGSKQEAELELQNEIIYLADQKDLDLITFGSSPLRRDTNNETFSFEIEADAPLNDVYAFLAALEHLKPRVAIAEMRMRRSHQYDANPSETTVYLQATLWAFWSAKQ